MTLDQLQIFIAVAEREHVTRAADALGLAPPSVSAAVASLEREFGTKLFHRVGRGIALTEGGKLVRRQRFWDNGLGKLREALAHQFADFRRPEAGAASGGWRWSVV